MFIELWDGWLHGKDVPECICLKEISCAYCCERDVVRAHSLVFFFQTEAVEAIN